MRERESSAAAACCALPVCCMLCAVSCSTAALSHCTYALFILCSSIFSTLLQAPVNCWTDFFSFLYRGFVTFSWLPKSKSIFSVCVGKSFRRTVPLSVQEREGKGREGGTHRGHPFYPEVDGRWKGVQLVLH